MALPAAGGTLTVRDLVMRVGVFLTELTAERSAAAVHADIMEQLSQPDRDPRLKGVADAERFVLMWTALRSGSSLPADGWQCVVLPTVVALSSSNELKSHLELATSLWMAASTAVNLPSQTLVVPGVEALPEAEWEPVDGVLASAAQPDGWLLAPPSVVDVGDAVQPAATGRRRRAVIVATIAAVLVAFALVWWTQPHNPGHANRLSPPAPKPAGDSGQPATASPDTSIQATPTGLQPVGNATPTPLSTQPVPAPTWNGPGPIMAPGAPQSLTVGGTTGTTVALSWQAPADAGTGGLAYYRIWRDGIDSGWTAQTSGTVTGLTPATSYTFTVTAHNGAGAASPPSASVTATTRPPQPQPPTHTGPPPAGPTLATSPDKPVDLGKSFTVTGTGWPCAAPATIEIYLGGKLVATPGLTAQGTFRITIAVDDRQPDAPTVAVIGSAEPLTLTLGLWALTAQLPPQPSCSASADQGIQIEFRRGPR